MKGTSGSTNDGSWDLKWQSSFVVKQSAVREGVKRNATKPKRFDQVIDSLFVLNFALSKLSHVFVRIYTWISLSCYMDFSKLIFGFF